MNEEASLRGIDQLTQGGRVSGKGARRKGNALIIKRGLFIHLARVVVESLVGSLRCLSVCVTDSPPQLTGGEGWNPQPADDQAQQPEPEDADLQALRRLGRTVKGDEGVDEGEDECDDNPRDGCACCDRPGVPLVEAFGDFTFPLIIGGYGGKNILISGELERDLLKGSQRIRGARLAFVSYVFQASEDHTNVQGGEDKRVGGQGRGPHAHDDWPRGEITEVNKVMDDTR